MVMSSTPHAGARVLVTNRNYSAVMETLSKAEFLYCDTEGSGLHPWGNKPGGDFHRMWKVPGDRICGISMKVRGARAVRAAEGHVERGEARRVGEILGAFYFPFRHMNFSENLPLCKLRQDIAPLLTRIRSGGFNYGYDLQMLHQDGVPAPEGFEEVSTAAHLLNENELSLKLKQLAKKYVRPDAADEEEVLKERLVGAGLGKGNMWRLPAGDVEPYACDDVILTEGLQAFYEPHLRTWKLYDLWRELNDYAAAILAMEIEGLLLDVPTIEKYVAEAREQVVRTTEVIRGLTGNPNSNPNSHPQMQRWLRVSTTAHEFLEEMIDKPGV